MTQTTNNHRAQNPITPSSHQLPPCTTHCQKNTTQTDQWQKPQPLPTRNNHPTTTTKQRTTTHNHCQNPKLAKNYHTNTTNTATPPLTHKT